MAGRPPPRVELAGPAGALDVECVATAPDHNARAVAHIAAVVSPPRPRRGSGPPSRRG